VVEALLALTGWANWDGADAGDTFRTRFETKIP
jgi:hypothetical protein